MLRNTSLALALLLSIATSAAAESSVTLKGSRASMIRQNQVAREQDFTFLRTPSQVERFVEEGYLVPVEGNEDYRLANVSYPYARPALRTFVERLGAQYRAACGERLVVTSLTRPRSLQPANAHELSVHPTGMAVDLRVSERAACREWLEETLLSLEDGGLLDVTRERNPPHYHVAVFPDVYAAHVERLVADSLRAAEEEEARLAARAESGAPLPLPAGASTLVDGSAAPASPGEERDDRWLVFATLAVLGAALVTRRRRSS